ncbi:unnamed protein product [Rotaria socialis]|uniref:MULE transposase domain-containing protein n=1 Tax=Rotaria socialis TaxID=392032 RepID=A0A820KIM0_9BILA|nr:unnamed protein product [Rotaria socialis]
MCSASVHTDSNNQFIKNRGNHNSHLPSPEKIELRRFKNVVKTRVVHESTPIGVRYDQELARANFSQCGLATCLSSQEASIIFSYNRVRRQKTPILPKSSDFYIPLIYSTTIDSRRFLLSDITNYQKRTIIFSTDEQLTTLFKAKQIMMDGTFDAVPLHFEQVYTVHGFPCAIALLTGKSSNIYKHLFDELETHATRLQLNFNPMTITFDFEKSLIKAVREKFPQAKHHGCYFHFCQTIYRKIQNLGLATHYRDDDNIRDTCRHLMSLPLLPCREVEDGFEHLVSKAPPLLSNLLDYFRNFWFRQMPVELWNVHNIDIRTNNHAEGWHNRFNKRINKTHPNFWHFISKLKQEEITMSDMTKDTGEVNLAIHPSIRAIVIITGSDVNEVNVAHDLVVDEVNVAGNTLAHDVAVVNSCASADTQRTIRHVKPWLWSKKKAFVVILVIKIIEIEETRVQHVCQLIR